MPKKKEKNSDEYWKGKWREVTKENRHLKKRLKQLETKEHIFDDFQDEEVATDTEDTYVELPIRKLCDGEEGCHKGYFEEYEIMGKVIGTCNICGRRKRLK